MEWIPTTDGTVRALPLFPIFFLEAPVSTSCKGSTCSGMLTVASAAAAHAPAAFCWLAAGSVTAAGGGALVGGIDAAECVGQCAAAAGGAATGSSATRGAAINIGTLVDAAACSPAVCCADTGDTIGLATGRVAWHATGRAAGRAAR